MCNRWLSPVQLWMIYFMTFFVESVHTSLFPVLMYSPKNAGWVYSRSQEKLIPAQETMEISVPLLAVYSRKKKPKTKATKHSIYLFCCWGLIKSQKYPSPTSDSKYCCLGGIQQLTCLNDIMKFGSSHSSIKPRTPWVNNIPFKLYQTFCMVNKMSCRNAFENSLVLHEKNGKRFLLAMWRQDY